MKRVKVGTTFRYTYADGNPTWTVIQPRGRGTWTCKILEDLDYTGTVKVFSSEEIVASIRSDEYWNKSANDSDSFFDNLPKGTIVHYSNGHDSYVRCEVTADKQLLPRELVGIWFEYDLPRRQRDGSISNGYHVDNIINKKTFRPHASNVYEYNLTRSKNQQPIGFASWTDPRHLKPVSLEVPPETVEQKELAKMWKKIDVIRNIMKNDDRHPSEILNEIYLTIS
jgi:hypothetical protein